MQQGPIISETCVLQHLDRQPDARAVATAVLLLQACNSGNCCGSQVVPMLPALDSRASTLLAWDSVTCLWDNDWLPAWRNRAEK